MDDVIRVSSSAFGKEVGRYQDAALTHPVVVSRNGRDRTVMISVEEYRRLKRRDRQVMGLGDFTDDDIAAIKKAKAPSSQPADDPVLKRFRADLDKFYGNRIERVVLFGSRARGEARDDSDYDVAVFLRDFVDRWQEIDRIVPIVTAIIDDTGAVIHAMPYRAGAYEDRTSLMREIRREGVNL